MAKRQMSHQPKPIFRGKDQIRQVNKVTLEVIVTGGSPEPIQFATGSSSRDSKPSESGVTGRLPCT